MRGHTAGGCMGGKTIYYVVEAEPRQEDLAERSIKALGIATYLPRYTRRYRCAGKTRTEQRSLFGRYFFVEFDIDANPNWPLIFSRRGVSTVMTDSYQRPKAVPEAQMAIVREKAAELCETEHEYAPLEIGQVVSIIDGAFKHKLAKVRWVDPKAPERVSLDVQAFGRHTPATIARELLEPVA